MKKYRAAIVVKDVIIVYIL